MHTLAHIIAQYVSNVSLLVRTLSKPPFDYLTHAPNPGKLPINLCKTENLGNRDKVPIKVSPFIPWPDINT